MGTSKSIWSNMWWLADGDPSERDRERAFAEFERLRTAKYEDVWQRLKTIDGTEWVSLREDLTRRWNKWIDVASRFGSDVVWIRLHRVFSSEGGGAAGSAALVWLPLMLLHVAALRMLRRTPNTRINRALRRAACPQCGYDVCVGADEVNTRSGGLVRPGPRLCPECGLLWPLLPPHLGVAWRTDSSPSTRATPSPGRGAAQQP